MNEGAIGAAERKAQALQEQARLDLEGEHMSEIVLALTSSPISLSLSRTQETFCFSLSCS